MASTILYSALIISLSLTELKPHHALADPADGFTSLSLGRSNFVIHKPYDVSESERYSFQNGIHKLWVYSADKPFKSGSNTSPRTEVRVRGYDYTSGVWQFEGYAYVPSGTTGVSIMQIFGGASAATTMMLRVYNGALSYYRAPIAQNIYDRWFRVNVIHDAGAPKVKVYIDGSLVHEANGNGASSHYFKFGVYAQDGASDYMESRWRGIKVLRK
ncbi:citrate-binding protein-like [Populus alba x Populus x berolinensis]|nr:citrate-binding protein-like [Populus alba x Populus x berolinensis]